MGLEIKQNKKGEFSLMSTIVDELIHDKKWVTEDEAKKLLIERVMWDAYTKVLEIDRCFPKTGFMINDKRRHDVETIDNYHKELMSINTENGWNLIIERIREIKVRLGVEVLDVVRCNEEQTKASYQKDINRLKEKCTKIWNTNILRKAQITSWNAFFGKLLREKRITKDELKQYAVSKEEMQKTIVFNKEKTSSEPTHNKMKRSNGYL